MKAINGKDNCPSSIIVKLARAFIVVGMAVCVGSGFAQTLLQSGPTRDSVVQIAAESQGLAQVDPADLPIVGGTYWWVMPGRDAVPAPCPPLDLSGPIYQISSGQFLVDQTGGQVVSQSALQAQIASSAMISAVSLQTEALVNLITQLQSAVGKQQMQAMARNMMAMDMPTPGGDSGGSGTNSYLSSNYVPPDYGSNLFLQIIGIGNGAACFNLCNSTGQVYCLWYATNLAGVWRRMPTEVWPGTNQTVTPFTVPMLGDSLFLRAQDWTGVLGDGGIPVWWYWLYFGRTDLLATNLDTVGNTLLYDYLNGLGSNSVLAIHAHWRFDNTNNWAGDAGQLPLRATNIVGVPSWNTNAALVESANPAVLCYRDTEDNGYANINLRQGTIRFWFKPDWSSLYSDGVSPPNMARLIEVGNYSPNFTNGWWALYLSPDGTQLTFGSSTNGAGNTNLVGYVSWAYKRWHQIALTYSPTNATLYCDGGEIADSTGTNYYPNSTERSSGLRIGSDVSGGNQAGGVFEDLETFNYQLSASDIGDDYYNAAASMPQAPTVTITSPDGYSPCLVGTNHSLSFTVNAQAALGRSIHEVDYKCYDYQAGQYVSIGVSTQPPFSLLWVNPDWTNAFNQSYEICAVAVDDLGVASDYSAETYITVELDSDNDGIPDWWMIQHFGHPTGQAGDHSLAGDDPDGDGLNNLREYLGGTDPEVLDPNVISFTLSYTNQYATLSGAPLQVNVTVGVPYYIAVLLDDTNFTDAAWNSYTSSNLIVNLGTTQGWHDVWVGLRGLPPDATQTWQWKHLYLASPPVLVITNPVANVVSQPIIQIYGYCQESLASISYDISNALGVATNQPSEVTDRYYDTNACGFTTSYFECLDVQLTNGLNVITIHATDLAGNTTVTNFNFTLDYSSKTNPPVVQITWPQDGTQICGSNFTCRGRVDDPTVTITCQSVPPVTFICQSILTNSSGGGYITNTFVYTNTCFGAVERNGNFWLENLPLQSGTNTFAITVKDVVGNTSMTNIYVVKSTLVFTINPVTPDSQLWQPTVNLTGTISSTNFAVWVNGVKGHNNGNGTWSASNVPVNAGGTASFTATAYAPNEQQPDGSYGN